MGIDTNKLQPAAHDFGDFVYCGVKWALSKVRALDGAKKAKTTSYDPSVRYQIKQQSSEIGKQNEDKCVDWVLKQNRLTNSAIFFNGTGSSNNQTPFSAKISGVQMSCKPDLIIRSEDGQLNLYEFKSVSDAMHLLLFDPFASNYAQVWCYTAIRDLRIDNYYLLRYYVQPDDRHPLRQDLIKLTPSELDDSKFHHLFEQYFQFIDTAKKNGGSLELIQELTHHAPKERQDILNKCSSCIYRKINSCGLNEQMFN